MSGVAVFTVEDGAEASSLWRRVMSAVAKIKRKVTTFAKRLVFRALPTVGRATRWTRETWVRVLRPFLRLRMIGFVTIGLAVGAFASPLATIVAMVVVGALLLGLGSVAAAVETSTSAAGRVFLRVLDAIMTSIGVAVYAATALLTIVVSVASLPLLLTEVLELVLRYYDVRGAFFIAAGVWAVLTGSWWFLGIDVASYALTSPVLEARAIEDRVMASNTRRVKLPPCTACGSEDDGPRLNLRAWDKEAKKRVRVEGLCHTCFAALANEDALEAAKRGQITEKDLEVAIDTESAPKAEVVQAILKQPKHKFVWLTDAERSNLSAAINSIDDLSKPYWAEVARWYDGHGKPHGRKWDAFVAGRAVARVSYEHDRHRKGHTVEYFVLDRKDETTFKRLEEAQEAVNFALSDRATHVARALDELSEMPQQDEASQQVAPQE